MSKPKLLLDAFRVFAALVGMVLLTYVVIKANGSSFTHDESFSYQHYMDDSFMELISYADAYTNNHILNSIGMKYSEMLFGSSELALRLPNVLALLIYLIFGYLLVRSLHPLLACAAFLLLVTNLQLVDLFGLARGYGLSFGFMLMSLYYYLQYRRSRRLSHLFIFHFTALLATLSNFTLLTYYVAVLMVHTVLMFAFPAEGVSRRASLWSEIKPQLVPFLISVIVLYEPIRRLVTYNDLDFGGKAGFFKDTIGSLVISSFPAIPFTAAMMILVQVVVVSVVLISSAMLVKKYLQQRGMFLQGSERLVVLNVLILSISCIVVVQHLVLGSDYPVSRFAAYLYPLFILHLAFLSDYFSKGRLGKRVLIAMTTLSVLALFSFVRHADLAKSGEWGYDSQTKAMMKFLEDDRSRYFPDRTQLVLDVNWLFEPTSNYYRVTSGLNWLAPIERENADVPAEYLYLFRDEVSDQVDDYDTIKEFLDTGTVLLRKRAR